MRTLILLAFASLASLSLSAHGHEGHGPRRDCGHPVSCRPVRGWEEGRWVPHGHGWHRGWACPPVRHPRWDGGPCSVGVVLGPMPLPPSPPWQGHVALVIR